ncbi:hypothetical protein CLU83_1940 [Flavobacterium sp. 1]|uniref:hypothetical protein n=1 Tax=Flavobacterium sp. 1 TaxID=2035200 RepID=UPI000C2494E2|nr:hypothetical protein [Flavobacterium sp. 1]PJJ08654.1 hypothetical protein CLU83_1940 [Flavobacterium sp. 1]
MEQAAILKTGQVVKLTDIINPKYSIYGFLNSFEVITNKVTKKFRDTEEKDFRDADLSGQINKDVVRGFYEEQFFLEYLVGKHELYELKNHKYTLKPASAGDEIIVKKLKVVAPYTDFCKIETYKWTYQLNVPVFDYYETLQIIVPSGLSPIKEENIQLFSTAMLFYSDKIRRFVTPADTDNKQEKAFIIAKIAILINSIIKDLFSKFLTEPEFQTYLSHQSLEWTDNSMFVNPTVEILEDYLGNLRSYYESFYANQLLVKDASTKDKFYWLATVLSAEALATVPAIDKFELLYNLSKQNVTLTERNHGESLALKIIESFTFESVSSADRNDLLNDLVNFHNYITLQGGNGPHSVESKSTLFEILYRDIDDDRYSRYTFGLWNSYNNRMKFIILLYRIWFNSTYNPIYPDPSYIKQLNACGVYEESPYMKLKNNPDPNNSIKVPKYYNDTTTPSFIIYESVTGSRNGAKIETSTNYSYKMVGKSIEVYEYKIESRKGYDDHYSDSVLYGTYEFLQPITVMGLKPDLDLVETLGDLQTGESIGNQKIHTIPAFLLFYMEDYSSLKKIDFGVMLAAEIALNLIGAGALADLRYLGYLSKMRSLWTTESVVASDVVLSWKAVSGVVNAFEFSAINAIALNNYVIHTTNDSLTKKIAEKANTYLIWATIGSMIARPYIQSKIIESAFELNGIVKQFNDDGISIYRPEMTPSQISEFDQALIVVKDIAGNRELVVNTMIQKLEAYGSDSSEILQKYTQITNSAEKYAFYVDYGVLKDPKIRQLLNANNSKAFDNWRLLYSKNVIVDRKYVEILADQTYINDLFRYYNEDPLRKVIEPLNFKSRLNFIRKFGKLDPIVFEKLIETPNGVILLNESPSFSSMPDLLTSEDVIEFLKTGPTKDIIGVRIETQRLNWSTSIRMYQENISFQAMSIQELSDFHSIFKNYFRTDKEKLSSYLKSNRARIKINCYNNSELIEPTIVEWYISGTPESFVELFNDVPDEITEMFIQSSNAEGYNAFAKNAFDFDGRIRANDTEVKFLYNFFQNHFHKGNKFVIEIESTLYTCTSCQKYLQAAQKYAKAEGKILEIKFIAHPRASNSVEVFKLVKSLKK